MNEEIVLNAEEEAAMQAAEAKRESGLDPAMAETPEVLARLDEMIDAAKRGSETQEGS